MSFRTCAVGRGASFQVPSHATAKSASKSHNSRTEVADRQIRSKEELGAAREQAETSAQILALTSIKRVKVSRSGTAGERVVHP